MAFFAQIRTLYASLTQRQRITLAAAAVGVLAALFLFARWYTERDFQLLVRDLPAEEAGQVVARLKELGVEYRVDSTNGGIRVPSAKVAETRLQLASEGLPKSGRAGYELFDKTNLGTSEFAEHINYQRALEGELERSVSTIGEVAAARVHLTPAKESIFLENRQAAKASVLLTLKPGTNISPQNVAAITHLISSAVDGLQPEAVSILDSRGNLLNRPKKASLNEEAPDDAILEFRRAIERDLLAKVNATLEPLLGTERFRAGVTVDCDLTTSDESEESFDPGRSVMATSQRTEDTSGTAVPSGVPGTASNLPRPTARPGSASGNASRRTENVTYQTSRIVRKTHSPQGVIRRVSASVLLDHQLRTVNGRQVLQPPPPDTLRIARDLVAGVVGFRQERGDQLVVEALPFESSVALVTPPPATVPVAAPGSRFIQLPNLTQKEWIYLGAGLGLSLLIVSMGWLFLRKRRPKKAKGTVVASSQPLPEGTDALETPKLAPGESLEDKIGKQIAENAAKKKQLEQEMLSGLKLPGASANKAEVLVKRMAEEAKRDPSAFAQVIRSWMSDGEG
jgi:flagellar M-ring protein FliF